MNSGVRRSKVSMVIIGIVALVLIAIVATVIIVRSGDEPAQAPRPVVGYVGDSLTVGGLPEGLQASLDGQGLDSSSLKIDGLIGRSIVDGEPPYIPSSQTVVSTWRNEGFHPNVWVIALISNDFGKSKDEIKTSINTLLGVLDDEPVTKILWVGPVVKPGSELQPQIDQNMYPALTGVKAERAGQLDIEILDLQAAIRGRGLDESNPALWTDDRHMTAAGYQLRNQLIVDAYRTDVLGK